MKRLIGIVGAAILGCAAPPKEDPMSKSATCCSSGCGCDAAAQPAEGTARRVQIEFLYLDLSRCGRCQGTDATLDDAVAEIRQTLRAAGVELDVRKTHVTTAAQAKERAFTTSPTVRVMGRDVQLAFKESACGECGELADCDVDCRVWTWRGQDHPVPPKEMLVDAILRAVYTLPHDGMKEPEPLKELPENLRKFFGK